LICPIASAPRGDNGGGFLLTRRHPGCGVVTADGFLSRPERSHQRHRLRGGSSGGVTKIIHPKSKKPAAHNREGSVSAAGPGPIGWAFRSRKVEGSHDLAPNHADGRMFRE
jgi:hypothetical protein